MVSSLHVKLSSGWPSALATLAEFCSPSGRSSSLHSARAAPAWGTHTLGLGFRLRALLYITRCRRQGAALLEPCLPRRASGTGLQHRRSAVLSAPAGNGRDSPPSGALTGVVSWSCRSAPAAHRDSQERVRAAAHVSGRAPAGLRRLRGARLGRCTLTAPRSQARGSWPQCNLRRASGARRARVSAIAHRAKVCIEALRGLRGFVRAVVSGLHASLQSVFGVEGQFKMSLEAS